MIGGESWKEKFLISQNLDLLQHGCHQQVIPFHLKVGGINALDIMDYLLSRCSTRSLCFVAFPLNFRLPATEPLFP